MPSSSVPVRLFLAATVQSVGRPARQAAHSRHDGTQQSTTSSPCPTWRHALADLLDHARALVAEHHRPAPFAERAVCEMDVGMAHARRRDAYEHLAGARRVEFDVRHADVAGLGEGRPPGSSTGHRSPCRMSTPSARRRPACRLSRVSGVGAEIAFDRATKRYPGRVEPAVRELTLTIPAGEICCLVGPSGAGKTTAMKMVNRLIDISEGDILIGGTSVRSLDVTELRRGIGYVIQQVGLFPHMSVADNVATVPRLLGWPKQRTAERVDELLDLVELPADDYRGRFPAQLSGGERQRVGLARALAADPPVMLMDEPFGALDPITRARLQHELLRIQHEVRKTIVFVTHDIDEAILLGDRIAILSEGGVLAQYDTPDALLANPADEFVARFLGSTAGSSSSRCAGSTSSSSSL